MTKEMDSLKRPIDALLKDFLGGKKKNFSKGTIYDEIVAQVIDLIFRPGAERLRPILVYYGYKLFLPHKSLFINHKSINGVLGLSLCTELFHTAALIHDDIMDSSKTRRGGPTLHEYFAKKYHDQKLGESLAILAGDLCLIWADETFNQVNIESKLLLSAKRFFDLLKEEVIYGQSLDLSRRKTKHLTLKTYEYKTAKYSFERPLHLGASLAGAGNKQFRMLTDYAIPVGIAFQIKDDLLDGEESLGTKKECEKMARELVNKGKKVLMEYNGFLNSEAKEFLRELADYCITRKS